MTKVLKQFKGKASSAGTTGYPCEIKWTSSCISYTHKNSKQVTNLNIVQKSLKLLKLNIRDYLYSLGTGKDLFSSVTQSCLTPCDPMDCSMLGFPVHHQLPELVQCPLSQWYHPTISSSIVPFCFCLQSFPVSGSFPMSQFSYQVAKVLEFQLQFSISPSNEYSGLISFWTSLKQVIESNHKRIIIN